MSDYLKKQREGGRKPTKQIVFQGEPFTALNLQRMRDRFLPPPG